MNNDICPAGTWGWLAHLGYSRADVERIVEQRHPNTVLVESHDPVTVRACLDAVNVCITKGPLPGNGCDQTAERNGLILAFNCLSKLLPEDDLQESVCTVLMSAKAIRFRRREAIEMYRSFCWYRDLMAHNYEVLTCPMKAEYCL